MKTEQELKRARLALSEKEIEIMNLEKKLERMYAERRELINFLDANKGGGAAVARHD